MAKQVRFEVDGQVVVVDVERSGYVGDQRWIVGRAQGGLLWAVPVGWPNNAAPVCEYQEGWFVAELAQCLPQMAQTQVA